MKLLEVNKLDKCYRLSKGFAGAHAVKQVGFSLHQGDFLGLVGESGCGKSTLANILAGLLPADSGTVLLQGELLCMPYGKRVYQQLQMVFQTPQESFDPQKTIGASLVEIQRNFGADKKQAQQKVASFLERVGLPQRFAEKLPHQLSGGECQRAAIARALLPAPKLLICDEITSALDVSVQAQIIELLQDLREELGLSLLFISHDLALVHGLCNRILVMHQGELVEEGTGEQLLKDPKSQHTRKLFSAAFDMKREML